MENNLKKAEKTKRVKWFGEARFGMFIHWGLYSILARGEWVMDLEKIPKEEYALLAKKFSPRKFNVNEWCSLAKEAGMKYIVFTAMHHDGFSLFDSNVSDFTSVKTGSKRDFVAEFVEACRQAKIKIGIYYSLRDWRYPAFFNGPMKNPKEWKKLVEYVHSQVKELMSNYGKIDVLWYDGAPLPPPDRPGAWDNFTLQEAWQSKKLNKMVRKLQPQVLINDRSKLPEDFATPEQYIPTAAPEIRAPDRPWESCVTMNDNWGYSKADSNWKSTRQLIQDLVRCVSSSGNFLLNIGPKQDGTIPVPSVKRLKEIGKWMKVNSESIYGCRSAPFRGGMVGLTTAKGNTVYLHVFRCPGKEICIAPVKRKIKSAHLLATGEKVSVVQNGERLFLKDLPKKQIDPYDTVIKLRLV